MEVTRYLPCSVTHVARQCDNPFTLKVSEYKQPKNVSCSCISCEKNPEWISSAQSTVGASCISCPKKCTIDAGKFLEGVSNEHPRSSVRPTHIAPRRASLRGATVAPAPPVEPIVPNVPTIPEGGPDLEDIYNMFFLIQTSEATIEIAESMKESFRKNKNTRRGLDDNLKRIETDKFNLIKINGNPDYCWLCGFFIDERVKYLKKQIEHPLAIKLLGSMFGTPDLDTSLPCIKRLFALNFLPSHEHCNQIKSQMFFVKWNKGILKPDLDVISFFLQKLLNGEKQSDGTNLFKRGDGTPLLRELIASQKFHMDITKNLAKWAIQRYSFIIHKIQDLCDVVNINNSFYTNWKSNIQERNYPSPEFNDTQNREIICKYNRDIIEKYTVKNEHLVIMGEYRDGAEIAATKAAVAATVVRQARRDSLRPGAQRNKQYGGTISNNVTAIEETYTNSKTKREDIWIITQKIYELIGANVENIFFAKGMRNVDSLERLKDELKSKYTEVVQKMEDTIDKCLEIFTENLKVNEPKDPKAYDIYNDEKLNKEIFINDWGTFLREMKLINSDIYNYITTVIPATVNGLTRVNAPIPRTFSQSFSTNGTRQRIRTPNSNIGFRPLGFPALLRPASTSPASTSPASTQPAPPRPASTPIARRTSFNEAEENSYDSNSLLRSSPYRSASRSGLLRIAGAGAAVLASGVLGRFTPIAPPPTSFVGNPIYEDSRLGRTRKRKNLKRKTRKHRK